MTQTCEIKTRLTLLTKSFCSRMGIQTTPLDAALRLSDAEVVKDLYQLWLEAGHEGTLDDFLLTFKGDQGDSNYQLWLDEGNAGTVEDFFATLHGKDIELRLSETHIQWKYVQDGEETWTNLIAREDLKGDEIQIGVTETHIIWKYSNETVWNNLISLAEITGPQGIQGIAGREVQIQSDDTYIQWKYADEVEWNNIVLLESLRGPQGIAGSEVEIQNSGTHIQWRYVGDETWNDIIAISTIIGADGINGEEIQLQKSLTHIQYKYESDVDWTDLVALADLKGDAGEQIQIQVSATHIQWKYESDVDWNDLIALSELTGEAGINGTNGNTILSGVVDPTNEGVDGDWYINISTLQIFGPKNAGVWGSGTNIKGDDGADGADGISIVWQGSLASAPENPELNWGYYNTTDGKSYIYDGDSWEIIAQDGTGGSGGDVIDDAATALDTTWSSSKIDGLLGDVEAALDAIIGA